MKKLIFLSFLLGFFLVACSEDDDNPTNGNSDPKLEIVTADVDVSGTLDQNFVEIPIHAQIKNTTSEELTIRIIMKPNVADGHSAAICTAGLCYAPKDTEYIAPQTFSLAAGAITSDVEFIGYIYPRFLPMQSDMITGSGSVEFIFEVIDNDGNALENGTVSFTSNYVIN